VVDGLRRNDPGRNENARESDDGEKKKGERSMEEERERKKRRPATCERKKWRGQLGHFM